MKLKTVLPILAISFTQIARAITYNAVQTGDWSNPASWDSTPFPDTYSSINPDSVVIGGGFTINYTGGMLTPTTPAGGLAVANGNDILIDGAGSTLTQTTLATEMRIGEGTGSASGTGTLAIDNGGTLDTGAAIGLGVGTKLSGAQAGNGLLNIKNGLLTMGAGASLGGLGVGLDASTGVLNVGDGSGAANTAILDLATNNIRMGVGVAFAGAGGTGTVTVMSDGLINFGTASITVGAGGGTGTLTVQSSGTVSGGAGSLVIGDGTGSTGTATNAGTFSSTGAVQIGTNGGTGTLTMTTGSLSVGSIVIAGASPGASTGTMTVSGGAISLGGNLELGDSAGANGTLNVNGGSLNFNGNHLVVGNGGTGTGLVNITAGTFSNVGWFHVASGAGSVGTVNVNLTNPLGIVGINELYLGNNGATNGTVSVTSGTLQISALGEVGRFGGTGTLNVSGANAHVIAAASGGDPFFKVGREGGHGIVNISAGASLHTTNTWFTLGENGSVGEATVTGAGSTLHSNGLILGWGGTGVGILNIADNAVVTNVGHELSVGRDTGTSQGTINISSGGVLNAGPETRIGHAGTGVVNVNGGTINMQGGGWAMLGEGGSANGTLNMSSGAVNVTANDFVLGTNTGAVGTYNQSGGATQVINLNVGRGGATGTLNLSGGTFNASGWTTIGRDGNGTGTINVSGTGVFNHLPSGGGGFPDRLE